MQPLVRWVLSLVAVLGAAEAWGQGPATQVTNQPNFSIPYRFDQTEMRRLAAREIRLFQSRNGGLDWQHIQTVAPDAGRFSFKAPTDGEFWFAVRTLDGRNQLHPDSNVVEPGLIVIVDRQAPDLQLLLQQSEAGRVQLSWSASDANLDPTKLVLEFSQPGSDWQPVNVRLQTAGQTSWSIPAGGQVSVRGSVADRAGNVGSAQTSIVVQAAGQANPRPDQANPRPDQVNPRPDQVNPRPDQSNQRPGQGNQRPDAADYTQPVATGGSSNPFTFGPSASTYGAPKPQSGPFSNFNMPSDVPAISSPSAARFPTEAQAANAFPPTQISTSAGQPRMNTAEWGSNRVRNASNGRFRAVKSHRFEINYRIDDVGPSGVSSVELFVTQNNGGKWYKYGDDMDRQSPFVVDVPEDGLYGFAIRVRSGAGLSDDPPQSGEEPAIVIVVDRTPPQVQLLPAQQGTGGQMNKITINWRVSDDNPSDKPVSLAYSAQPNGPWEPICGWQADTGSYVWNVNQGVPSRLYIRLVARDAAGNFAFVDTPQPLLVDLSKPTARIVDVESNGPQ